MALRSTQNIPGIFTAMGREVVTFLQSILDYRHQLIQTGMRVKWKSTSAPLGNFLKLDGAVITNTDYPALVAFAANDADFVVGATTTTLPTDAGFYVKT